MRSRYKCFLCFYEYINAIITNCLTEHRIRSTHPDLAELVIVVLLPFAVCIVVVFFRGHGSFLVQADRDGLCDYRRLGKLRVRELRSTLKIKWRFRIGRWRRGSVFDVCRRRGCLLLMKG